MDLGAWANFAEIFSGVVVIVSLVVLIHEVRENTKTQRMAAAQQVLGLSATMNNSTATNPELAAILALAREDRELTLEQQIMFNTFMVSIFAAHWQVHYQYQAGFLDQEIYEAYERRTARTLTLPKVGDWWIENKFRFSDSFIAYVDSLIGTDA